MASTKAMSLGSQLVWLVVRICEADPLLRIGWIGKIYRTIIPSNRSPLEAFADLKVAGGDLLEGAGSCHDMLYDIYHKIMSNRFLVRLWIMAMCHCLTRRPVKTRLTLSR